MERAAMKVPQAQDDNVSPEGAYAAAKLVCDAGEKQQSAVAVQVSQQQSATAEFLLSGSAEKPSVDGWALQLVDHSIDLGLSSSSPSPTNDSYAIKSSPQPAGESYVSDKSARSGAKLAKTEDRERARSETITSYEALEGSMKAGNTEASVSTRACESSASGRDSQPPGIVLLSGTGALEGPPMEITTSDGQTVASSSSSPRNKSGAGLRRGKWTVEEEAYVARVIQDFNSGFLDAPAGTTLRTYLSDKLQCDPMRITKKFTGDACIGKRVFHPAVRTPNNAAAIDKAQSELENLERRWRRRLEMQQRESAKKAAASAAAVAAGRHGLSSATSYDSSLGKGNQNENVVTRTASWLDRAKSVLRHPSNDGDDNPDEPADIRTQMQEVQRLIHEGPYIQESSAGLPEIIDQAEQHARTVGDVEPADKRMRTAEDAEALVGFLRSVRASAASGESF